MKLTLAEWCRRVGVSRQCGVNWVKEGRVRADRPAHGVILIDEAESRPERRRPWYKAREENISIDKQK
jgi:predicted site-specific integrase-resolvase